MFMETLNYSTSREAVPQTEIVKQPQTGRPRPPENPALEPEPPFPAEREPGRKEGRLKGNAD
jgi:hypothetical protein